MAQDISGFGIQLRITASVTFPNGFTVTEFADDADPFDVAEQQLSETAMTLNGDLLSWSTANPIPMVVNVIPGSESDTNLAVLAEANRVGKGKTSARDVITAVAIYPNGDTFTATQGRITNAMVANSVASAGRLKSKPYTFAFENKAES